ncbi:MAG TPA: S16 family serine protease, partial [Candidatus Bathyarchaeia archaeon]|nr:S16 family serine protease [Candidatus Bathyarchaeia archaeon]
MQESAKAALSYVRSRSGELKFNKNFFQKSDIHIHVPAGAIAKDGPSAGIAMATALASALTKRKVKKEVAMTGEVTLRGKVLGIGGVKEKILAAHRAGCEMVILPLENEKSLVDIPKEGRKKMKFRFAKHMDEVLGMALK